ncbi:MAG: apolipoprotein N-acyltransferase [Candidatus Nanopelagicaceae bacterium]|nr:apolipoprotein N-acyltransferase [Candidatus Nanopelagicaceae bacterium]
MFAFFYGILAQMAFAPISIWIFLPIALALIIRRTHKKSFRSRAIDGFVFSLGFTLPLLHWSSTYVGIWPWLILAIGEALLIAPFTWFTNQKGLVLLITMPSLWVILEWFRSNYPFGGFGWGRAGFIVVDTPFSQTLSLGGVPLASFVVVFIGVLIYLAFIEFNYRYVPLFLIVVANIFIPNNSSSTDSSLKIAAIQGSVPDLGLDFNSQRIAVLKNHLELTKNWKTQANRPANFEPDLFIWPENASDVNPLTEAKDQINGLVNVLSKPLIVGGVGSENSRPTNLSILWEPKNSGGGASAIYQKRGLAPFGEFMPLRSLAEFISPLAKNVTDFAAGEKSQIFKVRDAKILPVICFEILSDKLLKESSNSNLIIAQTNNATFGESSESDQQLQITRARAIEFGRDIVVVSTVGNTALIDQGGKVVRVLPKYDAGILYGEVHLSSANTSAQWLSAWVEQGCFAVLVIFLLSILKRRYFRVP